MEALIIRTDRQMKENSARISELIRGRNYYEVCADSFIKVIEDEIRIRQNAEDVYLTGFEYSIGL